MPSGHCPWAARDDARSGRVIPAARPAMPLFFCPFCGYSPAPAPLHGPRRERDTSRPVPPRPSAPMGQERFRCRAAVLHALSLDEAADRGGGAGDDRLLPAVERGLRDQRLRRPRRRPAASRKEDEADRFRRDQPGLRARHSTRAARARGFARGAVPAEGRRPDRRALPRHQPALLVLAQARRPARRADGRGRVRAAGRRRRRRHPYRPHRLDRRLHRPAGAVPGARQAPRRPGQAARRGAPARASPATTAASSTRRCRWCSARCWSRT